MQKNKTAKLVLDDGSVFEGVSFGYEKPVTGEVVFNTAMTGYPESLTDPSYAGQLMVLTYPLVGNYGVPPRQFTSEGLSAFLESEKIHAEAIIVSDYSYNSKGALGMMDKTLYSWRTSQREAIGKEGYEQEHILEVAKSYKNEYDVFDKVHKVLTKRDKKYSPRIV